MEFTASGHALRCGKKFHFGAKKKSWTKTSGLFLFRGAIDIEKLEGAARGLERAPGRVPWGVGGGWDETAQKFVGKDSSMEYNTKVLYTEGEDSFVKVSALACLVSGLRIVWGLLAMAKIDFEVFLRAWLDFETWRIH